MASRSSLVNSSLVGSSLLAGIITLGIAAPASAETVIGDWENSADGWIDWGNGQAPIAAPQYEFDSTFGVTRGTTALKMTRPSWGQTLSIKLQSNGVRDYRPDFFANTQFSLDFSTRGIQAGGWTEIFGLWINAQNYGFTSQELSNPKFQYGFPNGNNRTTTITWDYGHLVDGNAGNGEIEPTAGWIEFILGTNASDEEHAVFWFDNARLTRPAAPGDFNQSGALDAPDIDLLFATPAGPVGPNNATYDVNGDGQIVTTPKAAGSDADHWVETLVGTRYGDANLDKRVNFADLVTLAQNYNKPSGATWSMGSFNGDGTVNFADLVMLAQSYNFNGTTPTVADGFSAQFVQDWALAQSLVPEPTSLAAVGLAATLVRRRRA